MNRIETTRETPSAPYVPAPDLKTSAGFSAETILRECPPKRTSEPLPVLLSISAEQDFDGMEPDQTELLTEGFMELRPDGLALRYRETELTGMEGTTTEFEVRGPRVILRRTGSVSSQMVFEEGRQHTSLYETPFGELSIDVQTSYLRHSLNEHGGLMEIRYSISVEHAATGKNRFKLQVKPKHHAEHRPPLAERQ